MLELHGHPFSSYTWKALIPLYANGTPFTFVGMESDKPLHQQFCGKVHPGGHIPVLVDDGKVVVEATSIVEHLAVHHPGAAPLIPADPAEAVVARMLDRVFDNYVMGNMQRFVSTWFVSRDRPEQGLRETPDPAEQQAARMRLRQAYDWLEGWLEANTTAAARQSRDLRRRAKPVLCRLDRADHRRPAAAGGLARRIAGAGAGRALRRGGAALPRLFSARCARPRLKKIAVLHEAEMLVGTGLRSEAKAAAGVIGQKPHRGSGIGEKSP